MTPESEIVRLEGLLAEEAEWSAIWNGSDDHEDELDVLHHMEDAREAVRKAGFSALPSLLADARALREAVAWLHRLAPVVDFWVGEAGRSSQATRLEVQAEFAAFLSANPNPSEVT